MNTNSQTDVPRAGEGVETAPMPAPRSAPTRPWLLFGERHGLVVLVAALIVVFTFLDPHTFMTTANWKALALAQAITLVLGVAVMLPLVGGNFDLSIGANAVLCSMLCAACMSRYHLPLAIAVLLPVAVGAVIGWVNGLLVTRARLNGLIATIGTATLLQALVIWYSHDLPIATGIDQSLVKFGVDSIFGLPYLAIVAVVAAFAVHYLLTQTPFGRRLTALGSNPSAARLVGIRVERLAVASYVLAGGLAGLAGVMMVASQGSANPASDMFSVLISALTVVFLGAATYRPGEFTVPGMVVALILTAVLVSGLTLKGVASWVSPLCYGLALIVGVGLSAAFHARRVGS